MLILGNSLFESMSNAISHFKERGECVFGTLLLVLAHIQRGVEAAGVQGQGLMAQGLRGGSRRDEPPLTFTAMTGAVPPAEWCETDATPRMGQSFYSKGRVREREREREKG